MQTKVASNADEQLLNRQGYQQELQRGLSLWSSFAVGFATVSPVVGIYAVMSLGAIHMGPAWVWIVPICLLMQLLVALVYAELASRYPLAGGCYQWVKYLAGARMGWFTGYMYLASALASLSTVAYLGGFWLWLLFTGEAPAANAQVFSGFILLLLGLFVNLLGINPLKYFVNAGILAEAIASIGIGLVLLLFFRNHDFSLLLEGVTSSEGISLSGFLTAMAVGGWAFLGFDACSQVAEETRSAQKSTPRAILRAITLVGLTVMLTTFAVTLSFEDTKGMVSGEVFDPVTPAVVNAFGDWAQTPFVAIVLIAFIACTVSIQTYISRALFGMARDKTLPAASLLKQVDRRKGPFAAMLVATIIASAGLLLGLNATAVGTLIAFGSGGFYFVFLIVVSCALLARLRGRLIDNAQAFNLGIWRWPVNLMAFFWLVFEAINIAWPRVELAPVDAPWFQVWAVFLIFSILAVLGIIYLLIYQPEKRLPLDKTQPSQG